MYEMPATVTAELRALETIITAEQVLNAAADGLGL